MPHVDLRTLWFRIAGESVLPGAGRGVFAQRDIKAGTTLTEWVGLVAAPPATHADEIKLWQARGVQLVAVVARGRAEGRPNRVIGAGRAMSEGGGDPSARTEFAPLGGCDCVTAPRAWRPGSCAEPAAREARAASDLRRPLASARDDDVSAARLSARVLTVRCSRGRTILLLYQL